MALWVRRLLEHCYLPWGVALVGVLLCLPALRMGWLFDDDFHRLALTRPDLPMLSRSPAELFVFIEGNVAASRLARTMGFLPWWSSEDLRIAFFRPLTGFTHWLDYQLWPDQPALMHMHSLLWYGAAVAAAAFFFRQMFGSTWVAGLAALLFAVDDAHGMPAVWIANRNALLGLFFGFLTLMLHDRWRRRRSWLCAILAPFVFLLGLLSKESTVAIGAYLLAYALFLDRSGWLGRLGALAPYVVIGGAWLVSYRALGYGTASSAWYLDPMANPMEFVHAIAIRAPNLLAWQWLVPAGLEWQLSGRVAYWMWWGVMGFLVIVGVVLIPLLRRDRVARFWTLGTLLSLLPASAAYPSARLLTFVGIGGMGLTAQLIALAVKTLQRNPRYVWQRAGARVVGACLIVVHLGSAPRALARTGQLMRRPRDSIEHLASTFPADLANPFQTFVIVNTPVWAIGAYCGLARLIHGDPIPNRILVLGSGTQATELHRPDARTLVVRPSDGFFAPVGGDPSDEMALLLFNPSLGFYTLDRLYGGHSLTTAGQRIEMMGVAAEVTAITDDGRPAEVSFRFLLNLESAPFVWLQWQDNAYAPFEVPAVGQTAALPPATVEWLRKKHD